MELILRMEPTRQVLRVPKKVKVGRFLELWPCGILMGVEEGEGGVLRH